MKRQVYKIVDPNDLGRFWPLTQRKFYSQETALKAINKEFLLIIKQQWYGDMFTPDLPDNVELDIVSNGNIVSRETYTVREKND